MKLDSDYIAYKKSTQMDFKDLHIIPKMINLIEESMG